MASQLAGAARAQAAATLRLLEPDLPARAKQAGKARPFFRQFFEWAYAFQGSGVGRRVTRQRWLEQPEPCFWTVTRVEWGHRSLRVKRGKAYGKLTWRGVEEDRERLIRSPLKREWQELEFVRAQWNGWKAPRAWERPATLQPRPHLTRAQRAAAVGE